MTPDGLELFWLQVPPSLQVGLLLLARGALLVSLASLVDLRLRSRGRGDARRGLWTGVQVALLTLGLLGVVPAALDPAGPRWVSEATDWVGPFPSIWVLWGLASAVVVGTYVRAVGGGLQARRAAEACADAELQAHSEAARSVAGLRSAVPLLLSTGVEVPTVIGVVRPAILWPAESPLELPQATRAVLVHEMAHVRGRDLLRLLLGRIALALNVFNPLAWLAQARLREACEDACDDAVLACATARAVYARALARWAGFGREDRVGLSFGPSGGATLRRRLERVAATGRPALVWTARAMMLLSILSVHPLLTYVDVPEPEVRFVPARVSGAGAADHGSAIPPSE